MSFSGEIVRRAAGHKSLDARQQYIKLDPAAVLKLVDTEKDKTDNSGTKIVGSLN